LLRLLCLLNLSGWERLLLWWLEARLLGQLALRRIASELWLLRRRLKGRLLSCAWVASELRLNRACPITCWLWCERSLLLLLLLWLLKAIERLLRLSELARRWSRAVAASHKRG
jgi:hypothetical protein